MADGGWGRYDELDVSDGFDYGVLRSASAIFGAENLQFNVITFEPGEGGPLHYHHDPIEEYYVVLEGTMEIRIGDEVVEADEGTVLFAPPGVKQQPRNNSDAPAWILSISSPRVEPASDGTVRLEDEDEYR